MFPVDQSGTDGIDLIGECCPSVCCMFTALGWIYVLIELAACFRLLEAMPMFNAPLKAGESQIQPITF